MPDDLSDRIKREQELRKRWRGIARKRDRDEDEIRDAIHEINGELDKLRERRKHNRDDGDEEKAERWADEIEELEDHKDDLLEALDDAKEKSQAAQKILDDHADRVRGLRKKKAARKKSREGNGDLSPHFSMAEFDCRDGTPCPAYMRPYLEALCREHLEPLRAALGTVRINSGYRHAAYNASIGGATQSYHVYELRKKAPAADHIVDGHAASTVQQWHESHNPFDGMGFYAGFTHGDDRGYRSRWYGAG